MSENFQAHVILAEAILRLHKQQLDFVKLAAVRMGSLENRLSLRARFDRLDPDHPEAAELREKLNAAEETFNIGNAEIQKLFLDELARMESAHDQSEALLEILKNPPPGS